jgi:hypothetical protein
MIHVLFSSRKDLPTCRVSSTFAPKRAKRCTSAETSMDFSHESDAKMVRGLMWLHLHFIFHNDMGVGVFFGDFEMWIEATIQRWRNNGVTTQFSGDLFSSPQFWGQIDRTVGYRRPDPRSKWNHDWEVMQNNTAFRIIVGVILAIPLKLKKPGSSFLCVFLVDKKSVN